VDRIAAEFPPQEIYGDEQGDLLVIGWGGTFGAIRSAVQRARGEGLSVSQVHLRSLNPFPRDLEAILGRFKQVLVPELNMGQLLMMLRARFLVDAQGLNKVEGQPFKVREIAARIREMLA